MIGLHHNDALIGKLLQEGLRAAQADAQRLLGLYAVVLPVLLQAAEVEHGVTSYGVILAYWGRDGNAGGNLFGVVTIALDG